MGNLGRFEDNLRTYPRPANLKLIDRAVRYSRILTERRGASMPTCRQTARTLFRELPSLAADESIVQNCLMNPNVGAQT